MTLFPLALTDLDFLTLETLVYTALLSGIYLQFIFIFDMTTVPILLMCSGGDHFDEFSRVLFLTLFAKHFSSDWQLKNRQ